ncbi:MAG: tRNA uridine-5-carboxymethylaminomethyl(34) synthesis enzyme MnmG [Deltaproteobacteria bacterium]|nr:tRNA uridine-5-carboxymethylaminomethyl(34) synthesis enzyme MnmG [Deltaproteobacteria bacterium]
MILKKYDIIVVGAGHAGCEAALAGSRMGCRVLLMAIDLDKVASMPCSPSIGGTAKGQLVKEVDALGGEMAKISDKTAIQYRTLNTKKGPAVQSTRTQNDKNRYHIEMKSVIEKQDNLELKQGLIEELIIEGNSVKGVTDQTGFTYESETIVIAAGTFFSGQVHIGTHSYRAGRSGEFGSYSLPDHLKKIGFKMLRMKTGTPPRLKKKSIDFTKFEEHGSDQNPKPFSYSNDSVNYNPMPSYIGRTNEKSRKIVVDNISLSPLYSGRIQGVSARYCPSFEDKAIKFPDRLSHQVIMEPEGIDTDEIYASGLGNSLPFEVQHQFVRSVEGLEEAEIMRPAYAIEYDAVDPLQLKHSLESKEIEGLFFAGQINGTSGYEEAAAQGIWAGINAACKVQKRDPFILDRSEAYIGVMIDDLVTRGTSEPYRMFTSRAEYRLLLREDNADLRLSKIGFELGIVKEDIIKEIVERKSIIDSEISRIKSQIVKPTDETNRYLSEQGSNKISNGVYLDQIIKRKGMTYDTVKTLSKSPLNISEKIEKQIEIEIKYEGYIKRQLSEINKYKSMENIKIHPDFSFEKIHGLSTELKHKLGTVRPMSLGQASRIEGITPAALSVIMISLKKGENKDS